MAAVNSALQHMSMLQGESVKVHTRIATGLKVGSASDNGTIWAMAQGMRASNNARGEALNSMDLATGVVETALAAAEGISDLMVEMKGKLVAATDTSLDETGWRTLMNDFVVLGNQAQRLVDNATFNDINLLKAGADDMSVLLTDNPAIQMTVAAQDLSDGGGIFDSTLPSTLPLTNADSLANRPDASMVSDFETSLNAVNDAVSRLGVSLKALGLHRGLLVKQIDVTDKGIGNLVDADLGRESARLKALMVREELGMQAFAIANQTPQTILRFFQ